MQKGCGLFIIKLQNSSFDFLKSWLEAEYHNYIFIYVAKKQNKKNLCTIGNDPTQNMLCLAGRKDQNKNLRILNLNAWLILH